MKISLIKSTNDKDSFNLMKNIGFNVIELENLEETDNKLQELINNDYKTIFLTNEVASFSENIIKKYYKTGDIKIIITPSKKS